ncbi:hypothetical protein ACQ4M4_20980 [Leptolyngbya sp. AN02str]|uniref:hypothetical protein n=1 Tax=Leptolyngbya sp. AN02str TaxID=3423363 RepID=UPI003D31F008
MNPTRKHMLAAGIALALMAIAPVIANAEPGSMGGGRMGGRNPMEQLNLTDTQRQQLQQIRENTRTQMEAVLTAEQRQQMEQMRQQADARRQEFANLSPEERRQRMQEAREAGGMGPGGGRRGGGPFGALDLTEAQRTQLRSIMESAREQSQNVLTADQRQQLEQMRQSRGDRRGPRAPMQ